MPACPAKTHNQIQEASNPNFSNGVFRYTQVNKHLSAFSLVREAQ